MSNKQQWPLTELPPRYGFENFMMASAIWVWAIAFAQWLFNTWKAQYLYHLRKRRYDPNWPRYFIPKWPRRIAIFNLLQGMSCAEISDILRQHGVSGQVMSLQWALLPGGYGMGLQFDVYVPAEQFDFADGLLYQHRGSYFVESRAGKKRGFTVTKPWGVPAKPRSFDQALTFFIMGLIGQGWKAKASPVKDPNEKKKRARTPKHGASSAAQR